jgi:hypothetical protein
MVQTRVSPCEVQPVPVCTALTTRVQFVSIREDKYPQWVRQAKSAAVSHHRVNLWTLPDNPTTRNEHRLIAIWRLHDALNSLDRYHLMLGIWQRTKDRNDKPIRPKARILMDLEQAWRVYQEWDYG